MLYVVSGCSSGGKTTLIDVLASLDFSVSEEPGREIVRDALSGGEGGALPWTDPIGFASQCASLSIRKHGFAERLAKLVFFDRSLVDAVSALNHYHPENTDQYCQLLREYRYANPVFMAPPWPEIFVNDAERQHTYADSVAEYDRLLATYSEAGYSIVFLPKASVYERIEFILVHIQADSLT